MRTKRYWLYVAMSMLPLLGAENTPYQVGLGTFIGNPTGTLKSAFSSSNGLGASVFFMKDMGKGFAYLWDISCDTDFSTRKLTLSDGSTVNAKLDSYSTSLACTYHLNQQHNGFYVLTGLGAKRFQGTTHLPAGTQSPLPKTGFGGNAMPIYLACDTGIKLAYSAGIGYDFNKRWGAMVRYQGMSSLGHTLATIESGINFRF